MFDCGIIMHGVSVMKLHFPHIRRLSVRLTLYYSVTVLVALAILVAVAGRLFSDKLTAEMDMVVRQKLGLAGSVLDHSLSEIRALYFLLVNSPVIQTHMKLQSAQGGEITSANLQQIKAEMERLGNRNANVRSIIAITKDGTVLDPLYAAAPYNAIVSDNPEFDYFLTSPLAGRFSVPNTFPMNVKSPSYEERNNMTFFGRFYDTHTYEDLGYLAINFTRYSVASELDRLFESTFSMAYVLDENNNTVLQTSDIPPSAFGGLTDDFHQGAQVMMRGRAYRVYSLRLSGYPNWRIVGMVDYQQVAEPRNNMYLTIFLIAFALLAVVVAVSFTFSQRITVPLRALDKATKRMSSGQLPGVIPGGDKSEVGNLVVGFNRMVVSLDRLTREVADEHEQKKKIEVAMVQSQLDLLQSQINPHFIHNTLNTMKYMALRDGANELSEVITSFNALLRTSMSQENMMITVMEETENLRHYLQIQRRRYDAPVEFVCDISQNARLAMLPKLILQPLVENSLFHGVVPNGGGKITVTARTAQGRLWITVWDDGAGIPSATLRDILDGILPNPRGYNQIGLANVSERLVLYYGDSSRLVVQSEEENGTTISFSVPADQHCGDDLDAIVG